MKRICQTFPIIKYLLHKPDSIAMDSLTHITLGACAGEIFLGKRLGKKAMFWGALSQSFPDVDFIGGLFYSPDKDFLFHRGITHSIVFGIVVGIGLAFLVKKLYPKIYLPLQLLIFFFCSQLLLHDLLDTCNSYGTGLLEPFSHHRFSINVLYVADPLFTISLIVAALLLLVKPLTNPNRVKWAITGISISAVYLCLAGMSKAYINSRVQQSFTAQHIKTVNYFTTPSPFNSILWYIVAAADSGYYTGYSSIWDDHTQPVDYHFHPKNAALLQNIKQPAIAANVIDFAAGYYTVSQAQNRVYINVLRFEQKQGWRKPNAGFAFSYPLAENGNQALLLQKGRLAGWNKHTIKIYLNRIAGKQLASDTTK